MTLKRRYISQETAREYCGPRFWDKVKFPDPLPGGEFLPDGCW